MSYVKKVHELVKAIPYGRVATYGQISELVGVDPRMVGWALHHNPDPKSIPCHRVVSRNGRIAKAYAFGGAKEQRRRLLLEEVEFRDEIYVDLEKCRWHFKFEVRNSKSLPAGRQAKQIRMTKITNLTFR